MKNHELVSLHFIAMYLDLASPVYQPIPHLWCGKAGPCITNVIATCRKNFSQWESSFLWKLRCHWLKFLRRVAKTLVIQGPDHLNGLQGYMRTERAHSIVVSSACSIKLTCLIAMWNVDVTFWIPVYLKYISLIQYPRSPQTVVDEISNFETTSNQS